jgi:UDP-glucose 4-epimerase
VIDDLSTGHLSNIESIRDNIDFFHEKVENFDFNKISNIDAVVHLAAQASVPVSIDCFKESSSTNLLGTISVMEYCQQQNIPLVYASSSAIYGNLPMGDDSVATVDLLSPYAVDKYTMELYAKTSFKIHKLSSIGLRFFNVYGPRQDPTSPYSGVISIFADSLINGKNIVINGGYQTRDFVYVDDVIHALYKSVKVCLESPVCEQVNILTGTSISIDNLASMLVRDIKANVSKIYQKLPDGDPEYSDGTTEKMVEILDVELKNMIKIEKGLSETVKFLRG